MKWNHEFHLDSLTIATPDSVYRAEHHYTYDKEEGLGIYTYDSIPDGVIDIRVSSKLDRVYTRHFELKNDTTVFVTEEDLNIFEPVDSLSFPFDSLPDGKDILIYGEFPNMIYTVRQKTIIRKTGNNYEVIFNSAKKFNSPHAAIAIEKFPEIRKKADGSFSKTLKTFKNDCIELFNETKNSFPLFHGSNFCIVYENKLFELHGGPHWEKYLAFLDKIPIKGEAAAQ